MSIPQIKLAGKSVGRMGYGLMQLTWNPEAPSEEESFAAMKAAADSGATAWSTACFYGNPGTPYANVELIANFFKKYPEYKDKIVIVLKGGLNTDEGGLEPVKTADFLEHARKEIKKSQEILGDKKIDVYSPSRILPGNKMEDIVGFCKTLKEEGLFGEVGLSEVKGETLEKANKIVPIAVLEIEVSLWQIEPVTKDALASAQKLGIPVFCYSPLGRGFITRKWKTPEDIPDNAFQKHVPRFQGEAFYENLKLVDKLDEAAKRMNVETSQLALAWVVGLNDVTVPIPGSSKPARARQNTEAANLKLSDKELEGINEILKTFEPAGGRYPGGMEDLMH